MPLIGKGDEGEVDGVEHELNRHEHGDDIALDQEPDDAEREEHSAQKQIPGERYVMMQKAHFSAVPSVSSRRAMATAPRMAIRMSTDVSAKGRSSSWKSTWLRTTRFDPLGSFVRPVPR